MLLPMRYFYPHLFSILPSTANAVSESLVIFLLFNLFCIQLYQLNKETMVFTHTNFTHLAQVEEVGGKEHLRKFVHMYIKMRILQIFPYRKKFLPKEKKNDKECRK